MNLSDSDLAKIDQLIEGRLNPVMTSISTTDAHFSYLEIHAKTTQRRLDDVSDKLGGFGERLDNVTDRLDEHADRMEKVQEDLVYIKQQQRQDHHEVMVKLDELKVQETEDIAAAYTDIERLKKVIS